MHGQRTCLGPFWPSSSLAKKAKDSTSSNSFLYLKEGGRKALVTLHCRAKLEELSCGHANKIQNTCDWGGGCRQNSLPHQWVEKDESQF